METGSPSAASMQLHPTTETYSPAPGRRSESSHPSRNSELTEASGSQQAAAHIPVWLQKQMNSLKIPPTPLVARTWMAEAFDYLDAGNCGFPDHLTSVKGQLKRQWNKQKSQAPKTTASRAKRPSDTVSSSPAKRARNGTPIKLEGTSAISMPPPPPSPKPLGNLKGKYTIETEFACCDDQTQRIHEEVCFITLTPGNGASMRGNFQMGSLLSHYKALMFFEKRPPETSSHKVCFRWRGSKSGGGVQEFRGDENRGWIKFLGDGKIEAWFDRFNIRLVAQKSRALGGKRQHHVGAFWEDWHILDDEDADLLDRLDANFYDELDF
ncbi:hypothetical protein NW762_005697 [Fusarium torreyae]|uniref:Uncharacterized protein n=1 Tax=Fusarium torreyae TaxID=1237075 RepID=A0A9W8S5N0_9HYPO|nr:hypothetical protein NW762_005697 [Fusarium torreyae]